MYDSCPQMHASLRPNFSGNLSSLVQHYTAISAVADVLFCILQYAPYCLMYIERICIRQRPKFGFGFGYGAKSGTIFSFGYGRNREARFQPTFGYGRNYDKVSA